MMSVFLEVQHSGCTRHNASCYASDACVARPLARATCRSPLLAPLFSCSFVLIVAAVAVAADLVCPRRASALAMSHCLHRALAAGVVLLRVRPAPIPPVRFLYHPCTPRVLGAHRRSRALRLCEYAG